MKRCEKCGTETDWPEGSGACPTYHGAMYSGFCPLFVDGETAAETAARFHDYYVTEARENDQLRRELRALKSRGFLARLLGWGG